MIDDWMQSPYNEISLYSYLVSEYGDRQTVRPPDISHAISDSFSAMRERFRPADAAWRASANND
jgi:hypothetical protein